MQVVLIMRLSRAAILMLSIVCSSAVAEQFTFMTESFPPLNMSNSGKSVARNSHVTGLATDIIRKLLENTGNTAKFRMERNWDDAFNSALENNSYGVYSAFRTEEREDLFKWVGPLYNEDWVILAKEGHNIPLNDLSDIKNYSVGSFKKDEITNFLTKQGIDPKPATNDAVNVARLKNGSIEFWASSSLTGPYVASSFHLPVKKVLTFSKNQLWLAMNKNTDDNMIAAMNTALKVMHEQCEVATVLAQYR